MNNLARLGNVKADQAGVSSVALLDDVLVRAIEQVSREFEQETGGRRFYSYIATKTLPVAPVQNPANRFGKSLWIREDLLSVTTMTVDADLDGDYELTLVEGVDFRLYRNNDSSIPYYRIDLHPSGTQLSTWPMGDWVVQIAGTWGYSNETEDSGLTGTLSNTTSTTLTAATTAAGIIYPGDTLLIESEQVYVSAVSDTTITVQRAINGTTAAAHASKSLLVRRYPRDVEMAVAERVVGLRWDSQGGYVSGVAMTGDGGDASRNTRATYARWRRAVERYSLPVVG